VKVEVVVVRELGPREAGLLGFVCGGCAREDLWVRPPAPCHHVELVCHKGE